MPPALSSYSIWIAFLRGAGELEKPAETGTALTRPSFTLRHLPRGPEALCRTTPAIERIGRPLRHQFSRS